LRVFYCAGSASNIVVMLDAWLSLESYSILVGLSELIPAVLILFKRIRLIASILYIFTLTNVLAINIFFGVTSNTLILSIALLLTL
jgi:hypothetical protein